MNIFVLDREPKVCASYHCDKHVCKMIIETAQLLCGAYYATAYDKHIPYKKTHINHPCALWVRQNIENFKWLQQLGIELCNEYTARYKRRHKTQDVIEWSILNLPNLKSTGSMTDFVLAMPDKFKCFDAVEAYRSFYRSEKAKIAKWNKTRRPDWMTE